MEKRNLIGGIALLAILAGVGAYALTRPVTPPPGTSGEAPSLSPQAYEEHEPYYDIVAHYPDHTPLYASAGAAKDAAAAAAIKKFVMSAAAQFKTDGNFAALTPEDMHMMGFDQGRKLSLGMDYLISSSPRTISYVYIINEDTGGAHGNTYFHTFTFDSQTGDALTLRDLFMPGSEYLDALSSIARAKLPGILGDIFDERMMVDGTAPSEENFESFFLDEDTLTVLFAPYQVAAYAAGPQTLAIPRSELSDILKPEYR